MFWQTLSRVRSEDSSEALVSVLALAGGRTLELAPQLTARVTSTILQNMARLRYLALSPSPDDASVPAAAVVLGALQARVAELAGELDAQQVPLLLWALATLECVPLPALLAAVDARLLAVQPSTLISRENGRFHSGPVFLKNTIPCRGVESFLQN